MAGEDLLQSWKEIAAYLGRSDRTCRRWETESRLPIHRIDGSVSGSVFAYKSELDRWMDEILHEEDEAPSKTSRLRSAKNLIIILALAAIFVVAVAVVLLRIGRSKPERASTSTNPTLAILPFTNNTGDESLDFWENALADLLVSDLSQSRYLNVLSQDRVFLVLRDLDLEDAGEGDTLDLEKVAARAQVENIVVGNFIKAGQRFRISATVRNVPAGDSVVLPSVEARGEEEILLKIDELSTQIKNVLVPPVDRTGRDIDLDMGSITTSSIEAYKYYLDGRLSWYNVRAVEAMESLEKAVAIDPEFAMAYSLLAQCYASLPGHEEKKHEAVSRAFELSGHVSPRERFFIQANYYLARSRRSWGKALETCQGWIEVYPDDVRATLLLGRTYWSIEEWEKCIETLESIIDVQIFPYHIVYMRRAHGALGQYEEALEVAGAAPAEMYPFQYPYQLALNMIYDRRFDQALLEADRMLEHKPGFAAGLMVKGDVHLLRGEWVLAEEHYRELLNPVGFDRTRLRLRLDGLRRLANLRLSLGQFERALDFLNQAIDEVTAVGERKLLRSLHQRMASIHLARGDLSGADAEIEFALAGSVTDRIFALNTLGMILLEMGDIGGAERAAGEMKAEIDGWLNPGLMRCWCNLAGHIDLASNDVGQAVEHFEQAVSLLPYQHEPDGDEHAPYYGSLAYAYYLSGDVARAQEWYENIQLLTSGRMLFGDIYAKSHFMLGKIYEQRGMDAEAIRSYRKFLDLWGQADPTVPEVEEARRSLAALLG